MNHLSKLLSAVNLSTLLLTACTGSGTGGGGGSEGGNKAQGCSPVAVMADDTKGGCRIRLVTPSSCEVIDVSAGKSYEVAWTTDGTTCETPWKIMVAGNPPTQDNVIEYTVATNGSTITQKGGVIQIDAGAFAGMRSDNGTYHWVVIGFHGSHPASQNFVVKK